MIVVIIVGLLFMECKTTNKGREINPQLAKNEDTVSSDNELDSQGKLLLHCGSDTVEISIKNLNWYDFPDRLSNCLYTSGFNGNEAANEQIASMVNSIGYKFRNVFLKYDFRGPQIFEALLKKAGEYDRTKTYNSIMYSMIKRIDRFPSGRLHIYIYEANGLDSMVNVTAAGFEEDVEHTKLTYLTLKKAWEEGKIVLKDYGEK